MRRNVACGARRGLEGGTLDDARMPGRVTMKDLARAAKVSTATVSLAMRDDNRVSAATRERVRRVAEELGYSRDPALSALVSLRDESRRRTRLRPIGLARIPGPLRPDGSLARQLRQGVSAAAGDEGYQLHEFELPPPAAAAAAELRRRRDQGITGLVLLNLDRKQNPARYSFDDLVVVSLLTGPAGLQLDTVAPDDLLGVRLAWQQLRQQGCRRIGMALHSHTDANSNHQWTAAYLQLQHQHQSEAVPALPICTDPQDREGLDAWLCAHRPEAVLLGRPLQPRILRDLTRRGHRLGTAIRLVHLGLFRDDPEPTGIRYDLVGLGRAAFELLVSRLRARLAGRSTPRVTTLMAGWWQEGTPAEGAAGPVA